MYLLDFTGSIDFLPDYAVNRPLSVISIVTPIFSRGCRVLPYFVIGHTSRAEGHQSLDLLRISPGQDECQST
jgi:hypothetical protein